MKIVHLCLGAFFPDNYSYQENMLPKFHRQLGYDVEVIASLDTFDENGKLTYYPKAKRYINENDVLVTRLEYKYPVSISKKMRRFVGLEKALEESKPDILFIHNVQFVDISIVKNYLNNHKTVKVYCDNHADFSNSAKNWVSRNILHRIIWRQCARTIEPYTIKFYGVLPARVDFLKNVYKLPNNKCELLVMGADDDMVQRASNDYVREKVRKKYDISNNAFLVMTGGKIDSYKKQTLLLMDAVNEIKDDNVNLIVFGSVTPDLKEEVDSRCSEYVKYIGWQTSDYSYDLFAAADIVCFPGRHSVFWEQVVAQGIPMICKEWEGTKHVDLGGNVMFLTKDCVEEIKKAIKKVYFDKEQYEKMKSIARTKGMETFSYKSIAKRSIC